MRIDNVNNNMNMGMQTRMAQGTAAEQRLIYGRYAWWETVGTEKTAERAGHRIVTGKHQCAEERESSF